MQPLRARRGDRQRAISRESGKFVCAPPQNVRKILVVDDDPGIRSILLRVLRAHDVRAAHNGADAMTCLDEERFDLVISDINMPGMNGIELLKRVRDGGDELPVILITGAGLDDHASSAMQHRATGLLPKPLRPDAVAREVQRALSLGDLARLRQQAHEMAASQPEVSPGRHACMQRVLERLHMVYQPIVSSSRRTLYAHEALMRTHEPSIPHPGAILQLAEEVDRLHELGYRVRDQVASIIHTMPACTQILVNLHAGDLLDARLFDPDAALSRVSQRVVLTLSERASLEEIPGVAARVADLKQLGFRVAIDDIGAGYAGLTSFATLSPDLVRLDTALVRDIDSDPLRQKLVASLVDRCDGLGITVLAEGVETPRERDTLALLGCDLMQGLLFAPPASPFAENPIAF